MLHLKLLLNFSTQMFSNGSVVLGFNLDLSTITVDFELVIMEAIASEFYVM